MSEELQDIFSELAIKGWGEDVDKIEQEIERLNNIIEWQQNKIAKLNSENVCLKVKIELYEDGYILDKDSDKE